MKKNILNIIFLVVLSCIVAFFSLSYIFVDAKSFSEDENRLLQTEPRFTFEKLLDGTYTRQLHDYFSDQINLRSTMVSFKAIFELAMGKNENNGVLLGKDGFLIETYPYTDKNFSNIESNLNKIDALKERLEQNGINVTSAIIPRKVDVLGSCLPPYYSTERNDAIWELLGDGHVDLERELSPKDSFYKTDHHWTAFGAYRAYETLGSSIGYSPKVIEHFNLRTLSNDFLGTTYSTSGFFFAKDEQILAPDYESGRFLTTIVDIEYSFDGLYDRSYLEKKDKYSTFLSGNNAHVRITDLQNGDKETLLIIKDSYSHSIAPYLVEHYNIELIDPRYFMGSIEKYILENDITNVLFLFGADTLASAELSIK